MTREYIMTAYAVAHMRQATMGPQIVEYLRKIDATLEPFDHTEPRGIE